MVDGTRLVIGARLPGLNEIIDASKQLRGEGKKKWNGYQRMKKHWGGVIAALARVQGFRVSGTHWSYEFREPNRTRDPSNFIAGGIKLIEDALQSEGLLENDGWQQVESITVSWRVDKKNPGVTVTVGEDHGTGE